MLLYILIGLLAGAAAGAAVGYWIRSYQSKNTAGSLESQAREALKDAEAKASGIIKDGEVRAKAEVLKAKEDFENSTKAQRKEIAALEERMFQREANLDRKVSMIDKKEQTLDTKLAEAEQQIAGLKEERMRVEKMAGEEREKLQQVAKMTQEEAKKLLLARVEKEAHNEIGGLLRRLQEEAKETAQREAQKIVAGAIQRFALAHGSELMTTTVVLPGDDMKGRIIGRDGRNIRALEAATGINILIDDTPDSVVISGFDPIRREVARQALGSLITDGRIHPARIEEVVAKTQENMQETIRLAGENAVCTCGVQGVEPELMRMLGRLKFRTSYSQNVLQHSMEVSQMMGVMAGELGLDVSLAKRIGLFHDIGKALDHEIEGGHAVIGADLLKKQGEVQVTVNAVAAHHEEVPAESLYALLAAAADAISSSRVGARSETTDIYVKRIEKLEAIACSFEGVQRCYAIQAGREVRVLVEPDKINDNDAAVLARDICKKIETDLQYPGQIRVTVVRETRCVEYAR